MLFRSETKEEGLLSSGGAGFTIGSLEQSLEQKSRGTTAAAIAARQRLDIGATTVNNNTSGVAVTCNETWQLPLGGLTLAWSGSPFVTPSTYQVNFSVNKPAQ